MNKFKKATVIVLSALLLVMPVTAVEAEVIETNVIGSWEALVKINDGGLVTWVSIDEDKEYAINLRYFLEYIGYTVYWNKHERRIEVSGDDEIIIYSDSLSCTKNGQIITLQKPVYIADGRSYIPMSFLRDVLGIETISVDRAPGNNRINGIVLSAPHLPDKYRTDYPIEKDTIDGKPLYINFYDEINPSLPKDLVFRVLDFKGSEEIIVFSEAKLRDFAVCAVKYNELTSEFSVKEYVSDRFDVDAGVAVVISTDTAEGIPAQAITFRDSEGNIHSYLLGYNGRDGTVSGQAVVFE